MSNVSKLQTLLAALGTSSVVLAGCGGAPAPVQGNEVAPAMSAAPDASGAPKVDAPKVDAPKADVPKAAGSAVASAAPSAMPMSATMPKGNHTVKVADSKRAKGCEGGCGEGTCGTPCTK